MKVLVTGATGVAGRSTLPALVAAGHDVRATVRSATKAEQVRQGGAWPIHVDLFDPAAVREALTGCDAVCNQATRIPPLTRAAAPGAWRENDRIRRTFSATLVEAALTAGTPRLVQESIGFLYPDCGEEWITETVPPAPNVVTRSAVEAETNLQRFTAAGGTGVVLRFGFFYGPSNSHSTAMVRLARLGIAPTLGDPDGFLSTIHTDDVGPAVAAALRAPPGVYNVCDAEPLRRRELHRVLADALGRRRLREPGQLVASLGGQKAATMARSQRLSNTTFAAASGWHPRVASGRDGWPAAIAARQRP